MNRQTPTGLRRTALAAALAAAACSTPSSTTAPSDLASAPDLGLPADRAPPPDLAIPPALVRVVHASPDLPPVDLYVHPSTTPFATNVVYGGATVYAPAAPGILNIDVRYAGADPNNFPTWNSTPVAIDPGDRMTMVLAGLFTNGGAAVKLRGVPLLEAFGAATGGQARLRVVNGSPDAPVLTLDLGDTGAPQVGALASFADSGGDGVVVPAGAASPVGVQGGMPASPLSHLTLPPLLDRGDYALIATGLAARLPREANGLAFLLVGPAGAQAIPQDPALSLLHAAPDAAALDVFAGTTEVAANLTFGALSPPVQLRPGSATLDFFPHSEAGTRPAGNPLLSSGPVTLAGNQRYLVTASGYATPGPGRPAARTTVVQEALTLDAARAYLTVLDAVADGPPLEVGPAAGGALAAIAASGLAWGATTFASGIALPPSPVTDGGVMPGGLGFARAGDHGLLGIFPVPLAAGSRILAIAAGSAAPRDGEPGFRLFAIDTGKWPWTLASYLP